jgi:cellulose synthase/poly-beta-1,6-N-acetylglucosamine synthase-like glycosyltransferase
MTILLLTAAGLWLYAYVGYPLLLLAWAARRASPARGGRVREWPAVTIVVPVYNEAAVIGETLERLLASDYPAGRRHVLVVSDASTDGTDDIVRTFRSRGVRLHRMPARSGKTAAENAALALITDDIVINTDASVRVHPAAIRHLVIALADPTVGVASGRDVSVAQAVDSANHGESTYVGYEMWVRDLETRLGGIVGASGCLYAARASVQRHALPEALSRDFGSALVARLHGLRAVSVPQALCYVPRSASLHQEYRRKVRTMTRGLATLWYARALLNPFRYGAFAWMLASHKLVRWLLPWASLAMLAACAVLAAHSVAARVAVLGAAALIAGALAGWWWSDNRRMPRLIAVAAYTGVGLAAGLHAWARLATGRMAPVWEPTRRPPVVPV